MGAVKMDKPNNAIKCRVSSCFFYGEGDCCTANKIEVESRDAKSVSETGCATFRLK